VSDIRFLTVSDVIAVHIRVMAASGQTRAALVRPEALESAVHSARNLAWYERADVPAIAVHLATHISLAHPFVDGNKRTAATAGILFARYNSARAASPDEALEFGQRLIAYIEADQQGRESILAEFVAFVEGWFA
jgi:death-on-curing protein